MKLEDATKIATTLKNRFAPHCTQIEIAGSIRRERPNVKDIEIVAAPRPSLNLFRQDDWHHLALHDMLNTFANSQHVLQRIKRGRRYCNYVLTEGIPLDMFIVFPPAQWGVIFAIRTGPALFSRWLVTSKRYGGALPSMYKVRGGAIQNEQEEIVPTPTEASVFELLEIPYIPAAERDAFMASR